MELIEVSGYVAEEKLNIAQSYLVPQCRKDRLLLFLYFYRFKPHVFYFDGIILKELIISSTNIK